MNKIIFLLTLLLFVSCTSSPSQTNQKKLETKVIVTDTVKPYFVRIKNLPNNFDTVPNGNHVYRSSQPSLNQLSEILKNYEINTVIRMNGEEGTGITVEKEKQLVESLGKQFIWVNAHLGYVKGKGYTKSLDIIQPYLHKGNVLIHCTHGADRTGYQVAKYLQDKYSWDYDKLWNYTTKYNNWKKYIPAGKEGYIKYMEAFYPYETWKTKQR